MSSLNQEKQRGIESKEANEQTKLLLEKVDCSGLYESGTALECRMAVLKALQEIVSKIGVKVQMSAANRLNAVCIGPQSITREIFFERFPEELRKQQQESQVIDDFYVPFIEVAFAGIKVRLSFVSFLLDEIPEDFAIKRFEAMLSDIYFEYTDSKSRYSYKDCCDLHRHSDCNIEKTSEILRSAKFWAIKRGIYSTQYDFWYCSWHSMAAISDRADLATTAHLFSNFFSYFRAYKWKIEVIEERIN